MAININPNRINTQPAQTGKNYEQRADRQAVKVAAPKRAEMNFIPSPESLGTLIRGAVEALRSGTYWDRGSILNLLV
jgi:hypothetical protein